MLSVVSNMCKPSTDFVVIEQKEKNQNAGAYQGQTGRKWYFA